MHSNFECRWLVRESRACQMQTTQCRLLRPRSSWCAHSSAAQASVHNESRRQGSVQHGMATYNDSAHIPIKLQLGPFHSPAAAASVPFRIHLVPPEHDQVDSHATKFQLVEHSVHVREVLVVRLQLTIVCENTIPIRVWHVEECCKRGSYCSESQPLSIVNNFHGPAPRPKGASCAQRSCCCRPRAV